MTVDGVPAGTLCVATETDKGGAVSTRLFETPADDAADGKVTIKAGQPTKLDVTNVFPASSDAQVAGASVSREGVATPVSAEVAAANVDALPRTGGEPWPAVAVALLLVAAGGLARFCARRPTLT